MYPRGPLSTDSGGSAGGEGPSLSVQVSLEAYEEIALPLTKRAYLTAKEAPVLRAEECDEIILAAQQYTKQREGGWSTSRHYAVPTTDFPVYQCPSIREWFNEIMATRVVPLLSVQLADTGRRWNQALLACLPSLSLYIYINQSVYVYHPSDRPIGQLDTNSDATTTVSLHVHDAFVVKYDSGRPLDPSAAPDSKGTSQKLLPLHFDEVCATWPTLCVCCHMGMFC